MAQLFIEGALARARGAGIQGSADDKVPVIFQNDLLGGEFGFAINVEWIRGIGLAVITFASVEDEVGGKEHERDIGGEGGEEAGDFDIHLPGEGRIFFAPRRRW